MHDKLQQYEPFCNLSEANENIRLVLELELTRFIYCEYGTFV